MQINQQPALSYGEQKNDSGAKFRHCPVRNFGAAKGGGAKGPESAAKIASDDDGIKLRWTA